MKIGILSFLYLSLFISLELRVILLKIFSGETCFCLLFTDVTVLLSLTVFMNLVSEIMPTTSDAVPLIGRHWLQKPQNKQKKRPVKITFFSFFKGLVYFWTFFLLYFYHFVFTFTNTHIQTNTLTHPHPHPHPHPQRQDKIYLRKTRKAVLPASKCLKITEYLLVKEFRLKSFKRLVFYQK